MMMSGPMMCQYTDVLFQYLRMCAGNRFRTVCAMRKIT